MWIKQEAGRHASIGSISGTRRRSSRVRHSKTRYISSVRFTSQAPSGCRPPRRRGTAVIMLLAFAPISQSPKPYWRYRGYEEVRSACWPSALAGGGGGGGGGRAVTWPCPATLRASAGLKLCDWAPQTNGHKRERMNRTERERERERESGQDRRNGKIIRKRNTFHTSWKRITLNLKLHFLTKWKKTKNSWICISFIKMQFRLKWFMTENKKSLFEINNDNK